MINVFRYERQQHLDDDRQSKKIEVSSCQTLQIKGPFLQVTITHPENIQDEFRKKGITYSHFM